LDSYLNLNSSEGLSLTLDTNLQFKLFDELKTAISDSKAKGGSAIIMDASSGDVLAMVSYPSFNPNNPQRVIERNRAIEDFYEPGSLIKPITVAGAIRLDLIKKNSIIDTNPGFITLSDIKRSEAGGKNFGNISLSEAISKSSQVGIAKISIKFSSDQIRENLRLFGFGEYLNINWLSNNSGIMIDAAKLYDIDKASLGYGYGLTSNSLQIARAYSAFANEGVMIEPKLYLEDEIIRKRVLTKSNADFILDSLRMTVLDGTASNLKDEEVEIAGKTGTSEKYIEGVGYASEKYISSFASIFPVQTPKYIMIVSIDEPDPNKYFGGDVSAPVVARISKYMKRLNYL
jgi:cell division protein FtsI (penicillin-binding protein 3)